MLGNRVRTVLAALSVASLGLALGVVPHDGAAVAAPPPRPIYLDTHYSFAERAADLVSRMTTAEKASQMNSSFSPAIERLGVPQWGWWNEALHGVSREQLTDHANATHLRNTTSYPDSMSLASTWDPDLIYDVSTQISDEAREVVRNNTEDLDFYSPTMNLARDPRWGRTGETYSEDPFLMSQEVDQFVNGLQGQDKSGRLLAGSDGYYKALATIKHYAANNSESNRLNGSSDMDDRTLREYYTKAFRDVVRDANPGSVMSSYNRINGTPSPADAYLNSTLLRQTFGFDGYLTSDCDAIYEITNGHHWTPPGWDRPVNATERHALALAAGEDLDCNQGYHDAYSYRTSLPTAAGQEIPTGSDVFSENDIDTSLTRLLTGRMSTGEFDAADSVPWVRAARERVPSWTNDDANAAVTQTPERLALARKAGAESLVLLKNSAGLLPLSVPRSGAYKVAVVGTLAHPDPASFFNGDYASDQGAPGQANQVDAFQGISTAVKRADPGATVDYVRGFTGTSSTTPTGVATIDPAAVAQIRDGGYDAVVVVAGTDGATASPTCVGCGTEGSDRTDITLPGAQSDLINQIAAVNPHTVVYLQTLGAMDVSSFEPNVSAILWSSYNAQRQGEALADVLLGDHNPSGHLTTTWFRDLAQVGATSTDYAIRPTGDNPGRTYMYYDGSNGQVRYSFGYGLSYTTFRYSHLKLDRTRVDANGSVRVTADVTNTGTRGGSTVAQLYVGQPDAPAAKQRPAKRLEGFHKVSLSPGQTRQVSFTVKIPDLAFSDAGRWSVDPGRYSVQVGSSSQDVPLVGDVTVSGALEPILSELTAKPVIAGDAGRGVQQRVVFPTGATVVPQLTASLSDDSIFGYVTAGQSTSLPRGLTVTYRSNRPTVAAVNGSRITTRSPGVASITATASYQGVTKSTTFVVRVTAEASALRLDGTPVAGFHRDTRTYDVVVSGSHVPRLTATSADKNALVEVTQPSAVPGTGTVAVTGADGVTTTYTVNIARPASSDDFAGSDVGSQWSWVRPDAVNAQVSDGSLTITPTTGDLSGPTNTAQNLLVQPAPGDWTADTMLTLSAVPSAATQQAGLMAYESDDDYLKLDWEYSSGAPRLALVTEDDLSGTPLPQTLASVPTTGLVPGDTVWLRLAKHGHRYVASYSTDGQTYTRLDETGAFLTNTKVGVFAYAGAAATGPTATFDSVRIGP